jgi:hypothetical protein
MKTPLAVVLAVSVLIPSWCSAAPATPADPAPAESQSSGHVSLSPVPTAQHLKESWASRHPVLLGTLIGLGAGVAIGVATCKYPGAEGPCSYYTYPGNARTAGGLFLGGVGAGIGAAVGISLSKTFSNRLPAVDRVPAWLPRAIALGGPAGSALAYVSTYPAFVTQSYESSEGLRPQVFVGSGQ